MCDGHSWRGGTADIVASTASAPKWAGLASAAAWRLKRKILPALMTLVLAGCANTAVSNVVVPQANGPASTAAGRIPQMPPAQILAQAANVAIRK